jgi:hypothetical protein
LQAILVYLNPPNGVLYSIDEKQWRLSISLLQTIPNGKYVRQMLPDPDSAIDLSQTHFYYPYPFHGDTKHNENAVQDLPPN